MAYTETTTTSYGKRLGSSGKGVFFGLLLLVGGTILIWWNEGNFVKTRKAIDETQGVTISVSDVSNIDPALNGKVIHASAFANTTDSISDTKFMVGANAISITRSVEYYQWDEESNSTSKDKIGGSEETTTTYTYETVWTDTPINSSEFKDPKYQERNFTLVNIENNVVTANKVSFGAYTLPKFLVNRITGEVPINLNYTPEQIEQLEGLITAKPTTPVSDTIPDSSSVQVADKYVHMVDNMLYFGISPSSPNVGDVRVTFTKVNPTDVSIIAKVVGNTFEPFTTKNGRDFSKLVIGTVSAERMFAQEHKSNSTLTWILRLLGLLLIIWAFRRIFGIITTLLKVLPFLSKIVGVGVGIICSVLGFAWTLVVLSLAWLFYRPIIGIILIAVAVGLVIFLRGRGKDSTKSPTVTDTQA